MKIKKTALLFIIAISGVCLLDGCSLFRHHQPKSTFKIINEGDDNPYIIDAPTRAGTVERTIDVH